jgi:hypothetical protein
MFETGGPRKTSEVLPPEWRLQALVAVCNAAPVLFVAAVLAYVSLVGGIVTGGILWFVGGVVVALVLSYAGFCFVIAVALCRRRAWARFAAISVFLLYLLLHAWAGTVKTLPIAPRPQYLEGQSAYILPGWVTGTGAVLLATSRLLPWLNTIAVTHLVLRWRQFSQSAKPIQ